LKPNFHPVKSGSLKELGGFERSEQISETRNTTTVCFTVNKIKTTTILQLCTNLSSCKDKLAKKKKTEVSIGLQSVTSPSIDEFP